MNSRAKMSEYFPGGKPDPALMPLVQGNDAFRSRQRMHFEAQDPEFLVLNCAKLSAEVIHGQHDLGRVFDVATRGARLSTEDIQALSYAAGHFHPKVLEVCVHLCQFDQACRQTLPGEQPERVMMSELARSGKWREGLSIVNMDAASALPDPDILHARATSMRVLAQSESIHGLVQSGRLLLAEAFYDNDTGKVHYSSFMISSSLDKIVTKDILTAVAEGRFQGSPESIHPSLKGLQALVVGNQMHVADFHTPFPTDFVIFGCSDSRTSPYIIFNAPLGMIEVVRNAGNAVDAAVLRSLKIAVADALNEKAKLHLPERVQLVVMTHTRCGAVTATLQCCEANEKPHGETAELVEHLTPRLTEYRKIHPSFKKDDELLIDAATHNAVGAVRDILRAEGTDAEYLRDMVVSGKLAITPSVYLLKTGITRFYDPVTSRSLDSITVPAAA